MRVAWGLRQAFSRVLFVEGRATRMISYNAVDWNVYNVSVMRPELLEDHLPSYEAAKVFAENSIKKEVQRPA